MASKLAFTQGLLLLPSSHRQAIFLFGAPRAALEKKGGMASLGIAILERKDGSQSPSPTYTRQTYLNNAKETSTTTSVQYVSSILLPCCNYSKKNLVCCQLVRSKGLYAPSFSRTMWSSLANLLTVCPTYVEYEARSLS